MTKINEVLPYDYEVLLQKVHAKLTDSRYNHVLRVADTAEALAQQYSADPVKARIAGIVHDYAKQFPDEAFKQVIMSQKLAPELLGYNNGIWHGVVGTYFIKRDLRIFDTAILSAVAKHTTADVEMSALDQIIFIADYIEPNRNFPGIDAARKAAQKSLAIGVAFELQHTLRYLVTQGAKIYPKTIISYNTWREYLEN
ncbi:bis(5'-nucleosyl)-tetraphosphatase (symmetrical) YqeK [Lactobacillus sp. CC-MHH1034]|nr:bis(5'-nucleosyl)-tetraphosphatase (symmetrical) YqeK [Agrilactobacillus fermenti]MCD2256676.1 bis(5'-nucleosyl)-tetraphosphatase (symmetrical) YqeK [Agrilactobacillus fermenti]